MMGFIVRAGYEHMQLERVMALLAATYWARDRDRATVERSLRASLCYGVFDGQSGEQIGLARVITDGATTYYLCDVVVDERFRGQGAAHALMDAVTADERLAGLRGLLLTQTAAWLYEQYGFKPCDRAMYR